MNMAHGMENVGVEYESSAATCIALTRIASTWMDAELGRKHASLSPRPSYSAVSLFYFSAHLPCCDFILLFCALTLLCHYFIFLPYALTLLCLYFIFLRTYFSAHLFFFALIFSAHLFFCS